MLTSRHALLVYKTLNSFSSDTPSFISNMHKLSPEQFNITPQVFSTLTSQLELILISHSDSMDHLPNFNILMGTEKQFNSQDILYYKHRDIEVRFMQHIPKFYGILWFFTVFFLFIICYILLAESLMPYILEIITTIVSFFYIPFITVSA